MKKYPRRAATLAALIVILTSTLAPLEGRGAPGPMEFWDDPRELLGDPDSPPYNLIGLVQRLQIDLAIRLFAIISSSEETTAVPRADGVRR